jgi:hypothetical protein
MTRRIRDVGNSFLYPVVKFGTCFGEAFSHDVSRIRAGSFAIDAPEGLVLAGGTK